MGDDDVRREVGDGIATITLNRPDKLNAFSGAMRDELVEAFAAAVGDDAVRAIVLTGAGRAFSAGGDVTYLAELMARGDEAAFRRLVGAGAEVIAAVRSAAKPVIAAVHGAAAGGGMNLALACDFRLASTAARFSQAFVKVGMHPDWGGTYLLPRLVGTARALELMMTGRWVGADEALALGLVTRVVEPDALLDEARGFARELAAGPPQALAAIRASVYAAPEMSLEQALEREMEVQAELFRSADAREGMAAFREKRKPCFGSGSP